MDQPVPATPFPTEPGIRAFIARSDAFYPADAVSAPLAQQRAWYDALCAGFAPPHPAGLQAKDAVIAGVPVRRYRPSRVTTPVVLLYIHGGGFILGSRDSHDAICAEIAEGTGAELVAVDYRLAPEHAWPAQSDDAFAVLQALLSGGAQVIAVGDSAGGNLAAGLSVRLAALGAAKLRGQALIYPALGGATDRGSYLEMAAAPGLTTADVLYYREILGAPAADPVAHPLHADPRVFPPTFVTAAHFDPLRDDAAALAQALAGVGTECWHRVEPQMVHAWLRARHMSPGAGAGFAALLHALRHFLRD